MHKICNQYNIIYYTINEDGSIDVDDDVNLFLKSLTRLPIKFNHVIGNFDCSDNDLTTLEGAPQSVRGYFNCCGNYLTTLEGAPESVRDYFDCSNNKLTTLEGGPQSVNDYFDCRGNYLTTLKGAPLSVSNNFDCSDNKELKSLEYLSKYIKCEKVSFRFTPVYEVFRLLDNYSLGMIRLVNDLEVIVDDKINIEMLNAILYDHGKPPVESVKGYDNI